MKKLVYDDEDRSYTGSFRATNQYNSNCSDPVVKSITFRPESTAFDSSFGRIDQIKLHAPCLVAPTNLKRLG
ncbi:hypothetical protein EVAR_38516_1 [Eumeta japonica]|uniref:Uncharacterized protein n=1 Tax=Eumeta variegata TaxID=151549 RepID=A0A4C1WEE1_EUMVA|nr:hypothetical protein EVAR_38516_1 [Eumeta japonica]